MAPVHLGRLRRDPDHPAGAPGRHRDDDPAVARFGVPVRRGLRGGDGRHPRPLRRAARDRHRGRPGAARGLRDVPLPVVQPRTAGPRDLDRHLHAGPHATTLAGRVGRAGRPAGAVLRSQAPGPRGDGRGGGSGRRRRGATAWVPGTPGHRCRRVGPRVWRPPPVHEDGDAADPPRPDPVPGRRGRDLAVR